MIISKSFKYQLRLTQEQGSLCCRTAGSCRYVWNRSLALKKELWEKKKQNLPRFELDSLLTEWKKELPWLTLAPSQSFQQVNKDLDQAFKNFFHGRGYPKFKKKGIHDSFRLHAQIGKRNKREPGEECKSQIRIKSFHPGSGLADISKLPLL
ncbi:MAG: transposase [Candidatus Omnitrophota bacterium]